MKIFKIVTLVLGMMGACNSFAEDYSKINSSYSRYTPSYVYKNEYDWNAIENNSQKNTNYFSTTIQNPISLRSSKKYQNLINNSQSLNGCWDKAGVAYNVDPWLLFAIAKVESGFNHQATNVNKNKSVDIGMMQINTIWLPTLRQFGIDTRSLFDPCTSVFVGAWIVAQNIRRFGYNQDGIGAYNSPGNITIRRNYAKKVYAAYSELTNDFVLQARR